MARIPAHMKDVVRERLIRAAADHFAASGFDGARIDRISTDAGFAKGTIYNYFSSKAELFGAVVEYGAKLAVDRFEHADPGGGVRARLIALAEADVSVLREEESFIRVLVREAMAVRPDTYPIIAEHLAPFVLKASEVIAAGVAAGEVRDDRPPPQLALLFVGMLSLFYVERWATEGGWPSLEEIPELVVTSFLDGASSARRG
ncbi:MAG: TetR/AcrR family transcriptional regulator [Myxococcales bacterium]|nr:TetR/AcrR family transcriptional regulator [Myxococcales bacterium]